MGKVKVVPRSIIGLLKKIKKMSPKQFSTMVTTINDQTVDDLCQCIYNVIYTDLHFSKRKKACLKNHIHKNCSKARLKTISEKSAPLSKRRKAMRQEGKGLPLLLASAIPFLIDLFRPK